MKADDRRTTVPVRVETDHALPPLLQHPEDDQPVLARWVDHAMENQTRFWTTLGTVVAGLIAVVVLVNSWSGRRASTDVAWTKLETARSPAERVEIAKDFPRTPAGLTAKLQAATEFYNQGFANLPAEKDTAGPTLRRAGDLFEEVAAEAPADSVQARVAALGFAKTLEARNLLEKAEAQYRKVAATKAWAGTDEAVEADTLAKRLGRPEAAEFYKNLYAFKPTEAKLPPGGIDRLNFPMPFDSPLPGSGGSRLPGFGTGLEGSGAPSFDLRNLPPPPPSPIEPREKAEAESFPADPFAPEAPKAEPKAAPK